jgi:dynein heavy chain
MRLINNIDNLNEMIEINMKKLERAGKLIEKTKDEEENWKINVKQLNNDLVKLIGDTFLAAASISYIGPFTGIYRENLIKEWKDKLVEYKIPCSDNYKLRSTLGNEVEIRDWGINGLPSDTVSIDNGIMTTKSDRVPLMIDPQTQANTWIKNSYPIEDLDIVKLTESNTYPKVIERALSTGRVVLIENVLEEIDPSLDNILLKAVFMNDGVPSINFCDKDIAIDDEFKLFITSKLPNPHYLPEICIKLNVINFTVTLDGLEEQLLADVVLQEKPEVEKTRSELIINLANLATEKRNIEIKILK